jgi:hypothetical protein
VNETAKAINEAITNLAEVLIAECEGHDQFDDGFRERLDEVFGQLRKAKRQLDWKVRGPDDY